MSSFLRNRVNSTRPTHELDPVCKPIGGRIHDIFKSYALAEPQESDGQGQPKLLEDGYQVLCITHPELSRRFLVLKPAILPASIASDLFGSKQTLTLWLLFVAINLMLRVSKLGRAPITLAEWLVFLLACAAEIYATALSVTAALGALKAVGWKPAWVMLGMAGALVWMLPTGAILLAIGAIPSASRIWQMALGIASASCLGYILLLVMLWAEIESRRSA